MSEALRRNHYYPYADHPSLNELKELGWIKGEDVGMIERVRIEWTGEKRAPRKGEWYLSGAVIEGYRAANDLTSEYSIGQLVMVQKIVTYKVVSRLKVEHAQEA